MQPMKSTLDIQPDIQRTCDSRPAHHAQSEQTLQFHCTALESVHHIYHNTTSAVTSDETFSALVSQSRLFCIIYFVCKIHFSVHFCH